jgi:ribosome recycling factor
MINQIIKDTEARMHRSVEALKTELTKLRAGRASPSLLEHVKVSYYGNDVPLNQVANITIENARALAVTPWEKPMIPAVEKAIRAADLGLNPVTAGNIIRVPLPALSEERRKELIRLVKESAEHAKVSIRNIRRDANNAFKDLLKDKKVSEDEQKGAETNVQKITDKFIAEIDKLIAAKETDLMEV